jgi:hypothetical protein
LQRNGFFDLAADLNELTVLDPASPAEMRAQQPFLLEHHRNCALGVIAFALLCLMASLIWRTCQSQALRFVSLTYGQGWLLRQKHVMGDHEDEKAA